MPACGSRRAFHCSLLFCTGLHGNCFIYIHTEGSNGLDSACTHSIFFLAQTLIRLCAPIGLFGTDIYLLKYGRYLRGKKRKKKEKTCSYKIFDYDLKSSLLQVFQKKLEDIIKENVTVTC